MLVRRVEPDHRFIEQQEVRLLRQRARDEHATLLATGQFTDLAFGQLLQPNLSERAGDRVAVGGLRPPQEAQTSVAPHHHDVLHRHREVPVDQLRLRRVADSISCAVDGLAK